MLSAEFSSGGSLILTGCQAEGGGTHRVVNETPFYLDRPQQARPADGVLAADTEVTLVETSGSYALVTLPDDRRAYVASDSLVVHTPVTLAAQLADRGFEPRDNKRLMSFLERVEIQQGEYLIHQGEESDRLFFIEMGIVSIHLDHGDQERIRLKTLGLGTAIGELGLYTGTKRTASAIADSTVIAYCLTRAKFSEMKEKEPELAATFHEFVARLLSERLNTSTQTLEAVLR